MVSVSRCMQVFFTQLFGTALRIGTVAHLRDDTFQTEFAGVREHLAALDLEAFAELDIGAIDDFLQLGFPLNSGSFRRSRPFR